MPGDDLILERKSEVLEDGKKLGDYKWFTPGATAGAGAAGGGAAAGTTVGVIVADIAAISTAGAATGGVAIGAAVFGGIAYGCAKKFGWYEIECSIKKKP